MPFTKADRALVRKYFEKVLQKLETPVHYDCLRGYCSQASEIVQSYVRKECKGDQLLQYFKNRKTYFIVENDNVSLKSKIYTKKKKVVASKNEGEDKDHSKVLHERKLNTEDDDVLNDFSQSSLSNESSGSYLKNTSTSDISCGDSNLAQCNAFLSDDNLAQLGEDNYFSNVPSSKLPIIKKKIVNYFCDLIKKDGPFIWLDDLKMTKMPSVVKRFKIFSSGEEHVLLFLRSYPEYFDIGEDGWISLTKSFLKPASSLTPSFEDSEGEKNNKLNTKKIDKINEVASTEQCTPPVNHQAEVKAENSTEPVEIKCTRHFINILKAKKKPLSYQKLTGYLSQIPSDVYSFLKKNYKKQVTLKEFFANIPEIFVINENQEVFLTCNYETNFCKLQDNWKIASISSGNLLRDQCSVNSVTESYNKSIPDKKVMATNIVEKKFLSTSSVNDSLNPVQEQYLQKYIKVTREKEANISKDQSSVINIAESNNQCIPDKKVKDIDSVNEIILSPSSVINKRIPVQEECLQECIKITHDMMNILSEDVNSLDNKSLEASRALNLKPEIQNITTDVSDDLEFVLFVFSIELICLEIYENRLFLIFESVKYLCEVLNFQAEYTLESVRGQLGQAPKDVSKFLNDHYKGDKFRKFLEDHEEFNVNSKLIKLSSAKSKNINLGHEEIPKNIGDLKMDAMYSHDDFSTLCFDFKNILKKFVRSLKNKTTVTIERLSGCLSQLTMTELALFKLFKGDTLIEKLKNILNCFHFFTFSQSGHIYVDPLIFHCMQKFSELLLLKILKSIIESGNNNIKDIVFVLNSNFSEISKEVLKKKADDASLIVFISQHLENFMLNENIVKNIDFSCVTRDTEKLENRLIQFLKSSLNGKALSYSEIPKLIWHYDKSLFNAFKNDHSLLLIELIKSCDFCYVRNGSIYCKKAVCEMSDKEIYNTNTIVSWSKNILEERISSEAMNEIANVNDKEILTVNQVIEVPLQNGDNSKTFNDLNIKQEIDGNSVNILKEIISSEALDEIANVNDKKILTVNQVIEVPLQNSDNSKTFNDLNIKQEIDENAFYLKQDKISSDGYKNSKEKHLSISNAATDFQEFDKSKGRTERNCEYVHEVKPKYQAIETILLDKEYLNIALSEVSKNEHGDDNNLILCELEKCIDKNADMFPKSDVSDYSNNNLKVVSSDESDVSNISLKVVGTDESDVSNTNLNVVSTDESDVSNTSLRAVSADLLFSDTTLLNKKVIKTVNSGDSFNKHRSELTTNSTVKSGSVLDESSLYESIYKFDRSVNTRSKTNLDCPNVNAKCDRDKKESNFCKAKSKDNITDIEVNCILPGMRDMCLKNVKDGCTKLRENRNIVDCVNKSFIDFSPSQHTSRENDNNQEKLTFKKIYNFTEYKNNQFTSQKDGSSSPFTCYIGRIVVITGDSAIVRYDFAGEKIHIFFTKSTFMCSHHDNCTHCFDSLLINDYVSCYVLPQEKKCKILIACYADKKMNGNRTGPINLMSEEFDIYFSCLSEFHDKQTCEASSQTVDESELSLDQLPSSSIDSSFIQNSEVQEIDTYCLNEKKVSFSCISSRCENQHIFKNSPSDITDQEFINASCLENRFSDVCCASQQTEIYTVDTSCQTVSDDKLESDIAKESFPLNHISLSTQIVEKINVSCQTEENEINHSMLSNELHEPKTLTLDATCQTHASGAIYSINIFSE